MNAVNLNKMKINPSVEFLVAKYMDNCKMVDLLKSMPGKDPNILKLCVDHLEEISILLNQRPRKVSLIWRLLHNVDEQLILVMSAEELAAHGRRILQDLKTTSVPDSARIDWSVIVNEKVKELDQYLSHPPTTVTSPSTPSHAAPINLNAIAQTFKSASNSINTCVDDRFWDIWVRKFFAFIYGATLLAIGIYLILMYLHTSRFCLSITNIVLIGAIGGLVSGLITTEQEYMSKGHFWIPTIYYFIVRPLVGAVAAVVVFWMLESHYLIRVKPPLRDYCVVLCKAKSTVESGPINQDGCSLQTKALANVSETKRGDSTQQPEAYGATSGLSFRNMSGNRQDEKENEASLITLETVERKQIYIYMLVLFFAGFSGDKILKTVSCKINSRLFAAAEKTKES